ncbi:hypothetical protein COV61_03665 [Candidatus Micrarchaeota archaeon CG11_big_fil_rev_8_21_14_0_20_47_5]|nr:MAG: hypothetical protein COV61_03665 [Candidatus Micrarchaeota archaeon CG11_big_fil_rev_8_21_14_0_20_47_5]
MDDIIFLDPATIQKRKMKITDNDILSDLPYHPKCGLWFDHHLSSKLKEGEKFEGEWAPKKSAARVVYDYYENSYLEKYKEMVEWADKIDSGEITKEEALLPAGWRLLSETLESDAEKKVDDAYRRKVIEWLKVGEGVEGILGKEEVKKRAEAALLDLQDYFGKVKEFGRMEGSVAYLDIRGMEKFPHGNNYLIYLAFPNAKVSMKVYDDRTDKEIVNVSVGQNAFNRISKVNIGALMKEYGGGGHPVVGGTHLKRIDADGKIKEILGRLKE